MEKYPEIEVNSNVLDIDLYGGKKLKEKNEEPKKSGKEEVRYSFAPSGESCISCIEIPEAQRRTFILEIQQVAENILKAHGVINEADDILKGEWSLKLQKLEFDKKLVITKYGEEISIGLYAYVDDIPVPDPNLVLLSQNGLWYPQRIEEMSEETVSSFFTGAYGDYDFLNVIPENLENFQIFQRNFAKILESQGWNSKYTEILKKVMPRD
jgi:hypothetical protein